MVTLIFFILLFLALSAFFSGSEIAFVSANKLGIEIRREDGTRRGSILGRFFDQPDDFLGTMLVGNNISLVILTTVMTQFLRPLFSDWMMPDGYGFMLLSTLIITVVVLIFGEYLPKTVFRLYANQALFTLAYPLKFFKYLLKGPTWIMMGVTNQLMKVVFRSKDQSLTEALSRTDLHHYIEETVGDFNEDIDKEIFTNALNLNQLKVRDCLVPRPEIIHIDKSENTDDLISLFKQTKVSRILISDGDIENVIGYIHHQQLLDQPSSFQKLILDIPFVPEAMNARDLMLAFINQNTNIACVVDEFGGIAGIITLEDILEEISGEIEDEHDQEDHIEKVISENEFLFSGRLEIDHINETYDSLDIPKGEYHTLSGYIVMTSGSIPEMEGDIVDMDAYQFIIEKLSDTKIELVRIIKKEDTKEEAG